MKTTVGKVSKKIWIIAAVVLVLIAAGITIFLNTRPYAVLITGATPEEVTSVVTWLEGRGVTTYRYQGTDTILVPERQAASLKGSLLTEMWSSGTSDYSGYFDNVGMLSTEKERSQAWEVFLMERMAAVIRNMDGVQDATVTITPGEDRGYVLDSNNVVEASAAVQVTMRSGKSLDSKLASAIRAYVSHGVQGLTIDSVVVLDSYGNQFNAASIDGSGSESTLAKIQFEESYENKLRTAAMQALLPYYGTGHVNVSVNVVVEVGDSTSFTHDPSIPDYVDGRVNGQGIIGSWVQDWRYYATDETTSGGIVGTSTNSDILTNVERYPTENDVEGQLEGSSQHDYDNPYTDTTTNRTAAYITDCTVAVSLDSRSVERPDLEELRRLVANAVGITPVVTETMTAEEYLATKITIYSGPFYQVTPDILPGPDWINQPVFGFIPLWVLLAAAAGLLIFLVVLVAMLVSRAKKRKRRREAEEQEKLQQEQLAAELLAAAGVPQLELEPVGADVMSLQTEKSMELRQDIRQFAEENPEVAAQLLRTWLRGGEENA